MLTWGPFHRDNKAFTKLKGMRRAFFTGSNTSCQTHIHFHFDLYKTKCEVNNIPMNDQCISRDLWKMQGLLTQSTLDSIVQVSKVLKEFSKDAILHALAQLVACNNQVSEGGGGLKSTTKLLTFTAGICISKQGHVLELFNGHASQNANKGAAKLLRCHGLSSQ